MVQFFLFFSFPLLFALPSFVFANKKKRRKKNSSLKKNDSPKALSFCVSALKTAPHRARMLRRRALTFAERALTNSSSRRPRTGTATQKRGMGTCKSIVRGVVQPLFVFFSLVVSIIVARIVCTNVVVFLFLYVTRARALECYDFTCSWRRRRRDARRVNHSSGIAGA